MSESRSDKAKRLMREQQELADLAAIIGTPEGRRFYMRILDLTKVYDTTHTGDALGSAYNEGIRSVGTFLREEFMRADFNNVVLAEVERHHQEEENARRSEQRSDDDDHDSGVDAE